MDPDLDTPAKRLRWARLRAGYADASEFAKALGMNDKTYRAYENEQNAFAKHAPWFATKLGVATDWLLAGGPAPETPPPPRRDLKYIKARPRAEAVSSTPSIEPDQPLVLQPTVDDIEMIRKVDIRYAMGPGTIVDDDYPETGSMPFDRGFLRNLTRSPATHLFVACGEGDSMMPTLINDDTVLIDRGQRRIDTQDRIWAMSVSGVSMIKRVRVLGSERVAILSDNPSVPAQEFHPEELFVIGRVIWIGRRV